MQTQSFFSASEDVMKKTIDRLKCELSSIRTGRASSAVLEGIKVKSYGSFVPIDQIAVINIPDAKTIEIKPWDISQLEPIEKAVLKADIGMVPVNDGKLVRISVPHLTEDRRKEIAKSINRMAEEFKIAVRNERRVLIENIKKLKKDRVISEDDKNKCEIKAQKVTDVYIEKIDEIVAVKEKEIMQI
ncbi:MAG: ribosome recycling factor [Endomicrobium sp.]|jgi:ribosome recycling factor|nr:ribosome recycling factor [Endomicrobium sp.]